MPLKITPYDTADYLLNEKDVAGFLGVVLEDRDPEFFVHALGVVARSKGMTKVAKAAGVNRESLYRALSSAGTPSFVTVLKVLQAVGLELHVRRPRKKRATPKSPRLAA